MDAKAIALAYKAHRYVPTEEYRRGQRKKMYNPIRAAPTLLAAMDHLGEAEFSLREARRRAQNAVAEAEAARYLEGLDWDGLKDFLGTIALFLKAGPQGKERGMQTFEDRAQQRLDPGEIGWRALEIAGKLQQSREQKNLNKLKRMTGHIAAARDKWEALAVLARFYPLSGVPGPVVNDLVDQLGKLHLDTFKDLVARALLFYEAKTKGWEA
jgi:hypothetical protein